MTRYDDIINLPHHVSTKRQPMPMEARAAQFAPFAALSGHEEIIHETARLTEEEKDLSPDEARLLSERLMCQFPAFQRHCRLPARRYAQAPEPVRLFH